MNKTDKFNMACKSVDLNLMRQFLYSFVQLKKLGLIIIAKEKNVPEIDTIHIVQQTTKLFRQIIDIIHFVLYSENCFLDIGTNDSVQDKVLVVQDFETIHTKFRHIISVHAFANQDTFKQFAEKIDYETCCTIINLKNDVEKLYKEHDIIFTITTTFDSDD